MEAKSFLILCSTLYNILIQLQFYPIFLLPPPPPPPYELIHHKSRHNVVLKRRYSDSFQECICQTFYEDISYLI